MGNVSCVGNNCVIDGLDYLSTSMSQAFDVFSGSIAPVILGALVAVVGFKIARAVIRWISLR